LSPRGGWRLPPWSGRAYLRATTIWSRLLPFAQLPVQGRVFELWRGRPVPRRKPRRSHWLLSACCAPWIGSCSLEARSDRRESTPPCRNSVCQGSLIEGQVLCYVISGAYARSREPSTQLDDFAAERGARPDIQRSAGRFGFVRRKPHPALVTDFLACVGCKAVYFAPVRRLDPPEIRPGHGMLGIGGHEPGPDSSTALKRDAADAAQDYRKPGRPSRR